jgi:predicted RNase H-like HicB family nuclease
MKKASDVTALVVDKGGLFVAWARKLGEVYKKVYYYVPNDCAAEKMEKSFMGYGYPEIEVVQDIFGNHYDECDMVGFPDVGMGKLQLRCEADGKAVWGSRMAGDLEIEREGTKELYKELSIAVGPWDSVHGVDELREYLKKHKDVWVKISRFRGSFESFCSSKYADIETEIDDICSGLGILKYLADFVVEESLPNKVELGLDAYTIDGKYPSKLLAGIEIKDCGYAGKFKPWSEFPKCLTDINEKLAPKLKEWGARCDMSTEARIGKDKEAYPIDITMRRPSPPGELQLEFYTNLPEYVWAGANGEMVDPVPAAKFGVQANILSNNGEHKKEQTVRIDPSVADYVKLHCSCKIRGLDHVLPCDWELGEIGGVVGFGNTLEEAIGMCSEMAEGVTGSTIKINIDSLQKAEEELEKSSKLGLEMT